MDNNLLLRLFKRPKYKIGDIVVYPDRYFDRRENKQDYMVMTYQSRIIEAHAYLDTENLNDILGWFYITEHTDKEQEDNLEEDDVLYKLN